MRHWTLRRSFLPAALAVAGLIVWTGCPRRINTVEPTKLFVLFTSGGDTTEKSLEKQAVDVEDIQSLVVTLTEISFNTGSSQAELSPEEVANEDKGNPKPNDEEDSDSSKVVVFSGATDVDLMQLTDVAALIASAEVEPGHYTKIRLAVENPRLVLADNPDEVITDVQLTANGQMFISEDFELEEGGSQLLLLEFGGIHLVQTGNGKFVLTPQLRANLDVVSSEALVTGRIVDLDTENDTMVVKLADDSEVSVAYAGATIFLPADTDTPTGVETDLALDQEVDVRGTLAVDGAVTAQSIRIYAAEGGPVGP